MKFNKFYISTNDVKSPEQLQRTVNTMQQNIDNAFNDLQSLSIVGSIIVEGVVINTSNNLKHRFGKKPKGYLVISKNANANIWNGAITDESIQLYSSTGVTATIYIF